MVPDAKAWIRCPVLIVFFVPDLSVCIAGGVYSDGMYHAWKVVLCAKTNGAERKNIQMLQVPDDETKFPIGCLTGYQRG
jgi:hypothetical protein